MSLLLITIGMFIGWNFPQPLFASNAQLWAVTKWEELTSKTKKGPVDE